MHRKRARVGRCQNSISSENVPDKQLFVISCFTVAVDYRQVCVCDIRECFGWDQTACLRTTMLGFVPSLENLLSFNYPASHWGNKRCLSDKHFLRNTVVYKQLDSTARNVPMLGRWLIFKGFAPHCWVVSVPTQLSIYRTCAHTVIFSVAFLLITLPSTSGFHPGRTPCSICIKVEQQLRWTGKISIGYLTATWPLSVPHVHTPTGGFSRFKGEFCASFPEYGLPMAKIGISTCFGGASV